MKPTQPSSLDMAIAQHYSGRHLLSRLTAARRRFGARRPPSWSRVIAGQAALFDSSTFTADEQRWPCAVCGGMPVPDDYVHYVDPRSRKYWGADPCLGWLPGVEAACCGHDGSFCASPYVMLRDRTVFYGDEAKRIIRGLGGNPPA